MMDYHTIAYIVCFLGFSVIEVLGENRGRVPGAGERRILVNVGLYVILVLMVSAIPIGTVSVAAIAQNNGWGLFNVIAIEPGFVTTGLIFLIAFLSRTFFAYWLHRASHKIPILWRLHRIHHSDTALDVSAGIRHHPLEPVVALVVICPVIVALGLPSWSVVGVELILIAGSIFEHIDVVLPHWLSRPLSRHVSTPQIHEIHHSSYQPQTDSNYSPVLMIWDHLFGTYTPPLDEPPRIGLGDEDDAVADNLLKQLLQPFTANSGRG